MACSSHLSTEIWGAEVLFLSFPVSLYTLDICNMGKKASILSSLLFNLLPSIPTQTHILVAVKLQVIQLVMNKVSLEGHSSVLPHSRGTLTFYWWFSHVLTL